MKKIFLAIFSLFTIGILTSCTKAEIGAREAGTLLIQELVYQNRQVAFEQQFINGKELKQTLNQTNDEMLENLFKDYSSSTTKINNSTTQKLTELIRHQLETKTKFNALEKDEPLNNSGEKTVLLQIFGLDYLTMIKKSSIEVSKELIHNKSLKKNPDALNKLISKKLEENIQQMGQSTEPIETEMKIKKDGNNWYLVKGQEEKIQTILLNFLTGQKDDKVFEANLKIVQEEIGDEEVKEVEQQTKSSETP